MNFYIPCKNGNNGQYLPFQCQLDTKMTGFEFFIYIINTINFINKRLSDLFLLTF